MKIKNWKDLDNVENSLFKIRKSYCCILVDVKNDEKDNVLAVDIERLDKATVLSLLKLFGFDIEFEEAPKLTQQEWYWLMAFNKDGARRRYNVTRKFESQNLTVDGFEIPYTFDFFTWLNPSKFRTIEELMQLEKIQ